MLSTEPGFEADMLNVALFGLTASEWRRKHPGRDGNMRDYATLEQLAAYK
jgi:hypothetical protein